MKNHEILILTLLGIHVSCQTTYLIPSLYYDKKNDVMYIKEWCFCGVFVSSIVLPAEVFLIDK